MKTIMNELKEKIETNKWIESTSKGKGNAGITLEKTVGKMTDNFELPDYKGIEIKTKYSKKEKFITLFCATPDSYLFEIKRIQKKYGYPDINFPNYNVFNASISANKKIKIKNYYFKLHIDEINKKIILNVYNKKQELIDNLTSWSFELIKEKLDRKLKYLCYIHADRKYELNKIYYKYNNIKFYKLISFNNLLVSIKNGNTKITFRIGVYKKGKKIGQLYDHGTTFSINEEKITELFEEIII